MHNPILWEPSLAFVKVAITALLTGCLLTAVALIMFAPKETHRLMGPGLVAVLACIGWVLQARGHIRLAVHFLAIGIWGALTVIGFFTGGVYAATSVVFPLVVLLIGWLISARAALITGSLTILVTVAMVIAQVYGMLPTMVAMLPAVHGAVQSIMVGVGVLLSLYLVSAYQNRLNEIQRANDALAQRSEALESHRIDLNRAQAVGNVGSWIYDYHGKTMSLSTECSRIFGVPDGHIGTRDGFMDRLPREDQKSFGTAWKAALSSGVLDVEHRVRVGDSLRWIRQRAELEFDAPGQPRRVVGVAQDITDRKNAELLLLQSESKFRTIIEATPVPLALSDAAGNITYINKAFLQTIGYGIQDVPTMADWWNKACPNAQYRQWVLDKWHELCSAPETEGAAQTELEIKIRCVDGVDRTFLISTTPLAEGFSETTMLVLYDITEHLAAEESIRNLVFYDQLTNLPNRRLLLDRLKQALASSTRSRKHVALLFVDLDNFKTINDTHGHALGDLLLKQVSQRLASCVRFGDTVARLGGDEFVVMLEDLSEHAHEASQQAEHIGNKIIATLNKIYQLGNQQYHNTASIGVTLFVEHRGPLDDLLTRADLAMYQAKAAGRNALCFFDPTMQAAVNARAALEAGMREALLKSQFMLYYQPQVDRHGLLMGAECLLRWQHPNGQVVSPADFIPLAEETRLIIAMGQWAMQTACTQLAQWAGKPTLRNLTLSVNVSVHQFRQDDFVDQVLMALRQSGANPLYLKLELTESLLVSDMEVVVQKMLALKAQGVGLSLDDFGTGYSSLNYLKRLPLDQLKIDRSFVQDLPQNGDDAAIVKTIISLGQNLGLSIMAEGVETQAQRDFLGDLGCSSFQGYLFGTPLALNAFENWAHDRAPATQP